MHTTRPIRFGTSGWRGILGEEFTFDRVRAVVRAIADWVLESGRSPEVVVAHDTRLLGERLGREAASVLGAAGVRTRCGAGPVPTPAVAHAVVRRRAAAGIVFTASHNPPEYHGLKLLTPDGACAPAPITAEIERRAAVWLSGGPPPRTERIPGPVDLLEAYRSELRQLLDLRALQRARLQVVYDALHGAGAGVVDGVLRQAGVQVRMRRIDPNPGFGGQAPDPAPARLRDLGRELRRLRGLRLGLATDGDADRHAVVGAGGRPLSETEALALLIDHAARSGRVRQGVALTVATGTLPERVARAHGLDVERYPIGFKHLSDALREGRADLAGDESGGFALGAFGLDKDGILACCLFAELVAVSGAQLGARLAALVRRCGPSAYGRLAVPANPATRAALEALERTPPDRVGRARVRSVGRQDGLRLDLADGFVMLRASGTEALVRAYAEAPSRPELERRLRAAATLLAAGKRPAKAER